MNLFIDHKDNKDLIKKKYLDNIENKRKIEK